MTPNDDFGNGHDHDHEHEHEQHSAEGEWIASEPPVDDFSDEASADAAMVSEGNEHEHEPEAETEAAAGGKKKVVPLLLAGVVSVLAVGGFAYWHFAGHSNDQPSVLDTAAQSVPNFASVPAEPNTAPATAAAPASAPDVAPTTAYSTPSATPEATPEADKNVASSGNAMPTLTPSPSIPASTAAAVEPPPPSKPVEPVASVAPVAPMVPAAPIAQAQPSINTAAPDRRLEALSSRIDDLQKSLNQTTQQLGQITDKLANMTGSTAVASADPAMEERLSKIEQKIQQAGSTSSGQPVSEGVSSDTAWPERHASKAHHAVTAHKAHRKTARAAASAGHASKHTASHWVLRAATPGEAWIAVNAETRSLRPVHVGDKLDGIGTITAIRQVGDQWVVQGSHGSIR